MQNLVIKLVPLFLWLLSSFASAAQQIDSATDKPLISPEGFAAYKSKNSNSTSAEARIDSLRKASFQFDGDSSFVAYRKASWQYEMEALDHRHRVFEWQLASSKYIFFVVNVIVFVGLLLSVWQFYLPIYKMNKLMKRNEVTKAESQTIIENEEKKETHVSTIKLGKDGVEITSPVIGLLILVISIAFYFLYINFVYPVSEISHP